MRRGGILLAVLLATASPSVAEEGAWDWLERVSTEETCVHAAPGLSPAEAETGARAARSSVTFALLPEGLEPPDGLADGSGFVLEPDGLVVGPWSLLSQAYGKDRVVLWGRAFDGPWTRAFVLGGSWCGECGFARLAGARNLVPLETAPLAKDAHGRRFLAVGTALRRRHVVAAGTLAAVEWFDPREAGGRLELRAGSGRTPAKESFPLALRFTGEMSREYGEGSAVVGTDGRCVGMVVRAWATKEGGTALLARPWDLIRPTAELFSKEPRLDAPDLGLRLSPSPVAYGAEPDLPPDLQRLRATRKERGGAVVGMVSEKSPALGTIWPGDLVLAIEGREVFGDVPETAVLALLSMRVEGPVDVVLWRGGKRESVQVRAATGRSIYGDFQGEHDVRGGARRPMPLR